MKKTIIVLVVLLAVSIASHFLRSVNAQAASWSLQVITSSPHTVCNSPVSGQTQYCLAQDGAWQSINGALYTQLGSVTNSPVTATPATSKWVNGYDAASGIFSQTQPKYSDLAAPPTTINCPVASLSAGSSGSFVGSNCTIK